MDTEDGNNRSTRKRSRVGNAEKIGHKDYVDDGEGQKGNQIVPWQLQYPSSRIYRVCRATGGKDRHSKVYTTKGLRDRRIRLSVSTAIQFYDLQDRLGFDQPSKAIEWLLKAAANAINELPALNGFPEFGDVDGQVVADMDPNNLSQQNCSSTSETSKGSVLSLSRSESRSKATEKARDCDAKEGKDGEDSSHTVASQIPNLCSSTSFTELLTGTSGGSNGLTVNTNTVTGANSSPSSSIQKQISTAEYFTNAGLFTQTRHQVSSGFASQQQSPFGNRSATTAMAMVPFHIAAAPEMQQHQFSFMQDNMSDYNLNFTMSSSLAGFNRGTLQSNSQSQLPHQHNNIQRLSSVGNNQPLFFTPAANASPAAGAGNAENQFLAGFDGRLQLCMKGKGKG